MNGQLHVNAAILQERDAILEFVTEARGECREIPSYFGESAKKQMLPLELLGKSIELLAHADLAVFAPGWLSARGCKIEYECAVQYGIDVMPLMDTRYNKM